MAKHRFHLSEPWFSYIANKMKTIEGRLKGGKMDDVKVGDIVVWYNDADEEVLTEVVSIKSFAGFEDMLIILGVNKVLSNLEDDMVQEGVKVYRKYYTREKELQRGGVIGIELDVLSLNLKANEL